MTNEVGNPAQNKISFSIASRSDLELGRIASMLEVILELD